MLKNECLNFLYNKTTVTIILLQQNLKFYEK